MSALEDVKIVLNINNDDKDKLLDVYKRQSIMKIKQYLGIDADLATVEKSYPDAITTFIIEMYQNKGISSNVTSKSEGAISVNLATTEIPTSVKSLLPKPRIRVI